MNDLFSNLGHNEITVHVMLNLQERYPDLSDEEMSSYIGRLDLRLSLLKKFAVRNKFSLSIEYVLGAITDVDASLLKERCSVMAIPECLDARESSDDKWIIMFNGGPGTGKSSLKKKLDLPDDCILLDRDSLFESLTPYPRLKRESPDHATHVVVCEAILYNERDAFRYAVLAGAPHLLVDGTMSYLDLGLEMIAFAKRHHYFVKVINVDCPVDEGERRAVVRAAETGKTINSKLLYESHVRCALHFFEYRKIADATECWRNDYDQDNSLIASSAKQADGNIEETVCDELAFNNFKRKGMLPLDNPSWAPNYAAFLDQRNQ